ncbi:polymorphic toxin-type HINT domain-containing protein [Planctopirus hydrillae]|uniref:polymorphic toxin-type HINT domain-containing protein n=1 Tax=Planctopirus hydrillae TaxID=1841610 RepID=UPI0013F4D814|nr:DNA/RNA non-specific endonuclease [Planctopirus hydrillae]
MPDGWDRTAIPLEGRYVDWRKLELVLLADNAPCGTATLLRPVAWVMEQAATPGETIFLNLPEIGIEGPAQVVSIEETFVVPSPGRLITGVFRHTSGEILDLQIEGENQPLGTTKSHPFWSVDREDWIAAQDLQPGELLLDEQNQPVRLVSFTERDEPAEVYNLEIDGDHCYRVGQQGLLVHNASCQKGRSSYHLSPARIQINATTGSPFRDGVGLAVVAYLTSPLSKGDDFSRYPDWWRDLSKDSWRRGHLLGKQFGGPGGSDYRNLVPILFQVNNSAMATCENRIRDAIACGHCVTYSVKATYPNKRSLVPRSIHIVATSPQGLNINASIDNVSSPGVPISCSPVGPNSQG